MSLYKCFSVIFFLIALTTPLNISQATEQVKIGDQAIYSVKIDGISVNMAPRIMVGRKISWLSDLEIVYIEEFHTPYIKFEIELISNSILGIWNYATDDELALIYQIYPNYTSPNTIVDVTNFVIWSLNPAETDWTRLAEERNGIIEDNYTISTRLNFSEKRYLEIRNTTHGGLSWSFSVNTKDGFLQNLKVNTNTSIPGVEQKENPPVIITSIELQRVSLIMMESSFLQNVTFTIVLQVGVTLMLIVGLYLIGK
ncbi:MAG: hypothetical protein ACFFBD_03850, partial [Candidatus Hodarchaeota archaeon]